MHRDLKPENIMFVNKKDIKSLAVIDWGLAIKIDKNKTYNEYAGTLHYIAPELLIGDNYNTKCDMFAIGVITYIIISGRFPFIGKDKKDR